MLPQHIYPPEFFRQPASPHPGKRREAELPAYRREVLPSGCILYHMMATEREA
jgi:hypothetical protein